MLKLALGGADFSELCETLLDYCAEDDIPQQALSYLQSWINEMMVCELQIKKNKHSDDLASKGTVQKTYTYILLYKITYIHYMVYVIDILVITDI